MRALGVTRDGAPSTATSSSIRRKHAGRSRRASPGTPGTYQLLALDMLEDVAGNQIGRAFEVDNFDTVDKSPNPKTIPIPFTIGPPQRRKSAPRSPDCPVIAIRLGRRESRPRSRDARPANASCRARAYAAHAACGCSQRVPTIGWAQSRFDWRWRISGGVLLRAFGRVCRLTPAHARSRDRGHDSRRPRLQLRTHIRDGKPSRAAGRDGNPTGSEKTPRSESPATVCHYAFRPPQVRQALTRRSERCCESV